MSDVTREGPTVPDGLRYPAVGSNPNVPRDVAWLAEDVQAALLRYAALIAKTEQQIGVWDYGTISAGQGLTFWRPFPKPFAAAPGLALVQQNSDIRFQWNIESISGTGVQLYVLNLSAAAPGICRLRYTATGALA